MYIQLIRACLPLNTGKPQPHERVLRQGTWFYLSLDAYSVSSILERGTEVVKRLIHCDYPICFVRIASAIFRMVNHQAVIPVDMAVADMQAAVLVVAVSV